jgi:oligopeptide/dipeptide ABC transporter ATP-binding protein
VSTPLVEVVGLTKVFGGAKRVFQRARPAIRAVDGVSFAIRPGEVVGLVGESGSGKTTVGRTLLRLVEPTEGTIRVEGVDITRLPKDELRAYRRKMQIVFQDPYASLDPRMRVEAILGEAFAIHGLATGEDRRRRVLALLERVGLDPSHASRYPHEFSGGQRQRIVIARALAVEPAFIVADEPVSALDVSIQAQIVNLLAELRRDLGLAMLFISHDLSVVEYLSDRVIVMYLGRVMEEGPVDAIFERPRHPYTAALLSAAPKPDPDAKRNPIILAGDIPSPANPPSGCVFRTRCRHALQACAQTSPPLRRVGDGHQIACIRDDWF